MAPLDDLKAGVGGIRNRVNVRVLRELGLVEEWGTGYRRVTQACEKGGYPPPAWQELGAALRVIFEPHPEAAAEDGERSGVPINEPVNEPVMSYQTIKDASGAIQYVVVPYADFLRLTSRVETAVPNEVVERVIMGKVTPIRAWREHLGLTQSEVAARMEISQAALAQIESPEAHPRKSTLRRVAQALGIQLEQLDF